MKKAAAIHLIPYNPCEGVSLPKLKKYKAEIYSPDMTKKWNRFLSRNNLPKIRLHDLRHSNATALIQAGVNPRVVQQRLGHADVNITLNTYTHEFQAAQARASGVIKETLNFSKKPFKNIPQIIENAGMQLLYLPPYSPDFNPIEKMRSKIKAILRKIKPRNIDDLLQAIKSAFLYVTFLDCKGWSLSCGVSC